ncbi:nucleotidyltransferase family protein [Devosia sp. A8/3-2]|nr:nucleotidyltransferase family protein [Devosia sp. A8/3-2]
MSSISDDSDLSYEAEDLVIRRATERFGDLPYRSKCATSAGAFVVSRKVRHALSAISSSAEMMDYFASKTHAVAARLEDDDAISIFAPFGLDDMFSFRITPNPALDNRNTHYVKAERNKGIWPELTVVPRPD